MELPKIEMEEVEGKKYTYFFLFDHTNECYLDRWFIDHKNIDKDLRRMNNDLLNIGFNLYGVKL